MRQRRTGLLVLAAAALLAAGCGSAAVTSTASPPESSGPVSSAPVSSGSVSSGSVSSAASSAGAPSETSRQRAAADACAILGRFVPPPGAVRLAGRPALPADSPTMGLNSVDQADAAAYWRASGAATALLAWEKTHITGGFSRQDVIIGPPSWNTVYSLPAVPGVLSTRELNVQFYDASDGSVVIMADAMVAWVPPRPASEMIPATVTQVTVTPLGSWPGHPAPVTVTSAAVVRRLATLVNGLPLSTAGDAPCASAAFGLSLTFRAAPGGPDVADVSPAACGALSLRLGGQDEPALMPPATFQATILRMAGLSWQSAAQPGTVSGARG